MRTGNIILVIETLQKDKEDNTTCVQFKDGFLWICTKFSFPQTNLNKTKEKYKKQKEKYNLCRT